jgi:alpha-1,6-mannosyltransferase
VVTVTTSDPTRSQTSERIWRRVAIAAGLGLLAICAWPLATVLAHPHALHRDLLWDRFTERRVILLAFLPYAIGLYALHRAGASRRAIVAFGMGCIGVLVAVPAVGSRDLFSYLFYGRMLVSHVNPLTRAPNVLAADSWFRSIAWRRTPSVYGPAWTYASSGVAALTWPRLWAGALALKLASVGGAIAGSVMTAGLAGGEERRRSWVLAACLCNPLVLFSIAGDGHVDGVLIGLIIGALVARRRENHGLAAALLVVATLIKIYCGVFLVLYVASLLFDRERIKASVGIAAASIAGIAAAYAPLWAGRETFAGFASVDTMYTAGFPDVLRGQVSDYLLDNRASSLHATAVGSDVARLASAGIFIVLLAALAFRYRSQISSERAWGFAFAGYCFLATWFLPWHMIPLLGLALAHPRSPVHRVDLAAGALVLSATSLVTIVGVRFGVPAVVAIAMPYLSRRWGTPVAAG